MDIVKVKKINELAKSLKDSGLAATMEEGIKKAREMVLSEEELKEDSADEIKDKIEEVRDVIDDAEKGELPAEAVEAEMGELIEEIDEKNAEEETVKEPVEKGPSAQELIDDVKEDIPEPKPVVEELKDEKTCPECGKKGFFSKICDFCGSLTHKEKDIPTPPKPKEDDIDEHIVKEDYV